MGVSINYPSSILCHRRGVALLMVLLIVAAIAILATGFLAGTDAELACGANTLLRIEMDELAQSGLDHARGLVLHPQDVPAAFWTTGATAQQLVADSRDYYDVHVALDTTFSDNCTYSLTCEAYHQLDNGQKTGRSSLAASLRLDPCIALEVGATTTLWNGLKIYGDVYSKGGLVNDGLIGGDVFANTLSGLGTKTGQLNPQTLTLAWPPVTAAYVNPQYLPHSIAATLHGTCQPDGIWRCMGNLVIDGPSTVKGLLLVPGDLLIRTAAGGSRIVAAKGLPALFVGGNLTLENISDLRVDGLVIVGGNVTIGASSSNIIIVGGLFVGGVLDPSSAGSGVTIVADPMKAAVLSWQGGVPQAWSPAAGGFYRSIRRG